MTILLAESYIHDLNPVIVDLPGNFAIRWYGMSYLAGFVIAWLLLRWMSKTGRIAISPAQLADFMFYVIAGVIIGGRLGYVFFYDQSLLWPPWGILRVWDGGMASHGGIIGVIVACIAFGARKKVSMLHTLDFAAFVCAPGLMLGRIANFINGELWGRPLPMSMRADPPWWSVKYPTEIVERWQRVVATTDEETLRELVPRMAADFGITAPDYAALKEDVIAEAMRRLEALEPLRESRPGGADSHGAIVDAAYAASETVINALRPLLTPYYPSQLIQAFAEGIVLFGALAIIWLSPRKPGFIGACFLFIYGLLRVLTEMYRQPDEGVAQLATPWYDLSRGQVLSALMIAAGAVCIVIALRRDALKVGGLLRTTRGAVV